MKKAILSIAIGLITSIFGYYLSFGISDKLDAKTGEIYIMQTIYISIIYFCGIIAACTYLIISNSKK